MFLKRLYLIYLIILSFCIIYLIIQCNQDLKNDQNSSDEDDYFDGSIDNVSDDDCYDDDADDNNNNDGNNERTNRGNDEGVDGGNDERRRDVDGKNGRHDCKD